MISETRPAETSSPLLSAFLAALPNHPKTPPPGAEAFVQAIAADYRPEELPSVRLTELAGRAAGLWTFAQNAKGDAPVIRITPAIAGDGADIAAELVEIVQPDAPFLVDSVMGELVDAGANVLAMFHPVVETKAGRRSAIQVWLEPMGLEKTPHIEAGLRATLADVRRSVDDFGAMAQLMARSIDELKADAPADDPERLAEDLAFLAWLAADHFVFLGARAYDYPRDPDGGYAAEEPAVDAGSGLGVLRDPARAVLRRASEPAVLSAQHAPASWRPRTPLIVAKSNLKSRVHRRAYMDYVGVRRYGAGRQAVRRDPLRRPVHRPGLRRAGAQHAADPAQDRPGDGAGRPGRRRPQRRCGSPTSWRPIRATSSSRSPRTSCCASRSASCTSPTGRA